MPRAAAVALAVVVLAGCQSTEKKRPVAGDRTTDVAVLLRHIEAVHPNPWHAASEREFKAAARRLDSRFARLSRDEQLVELMRLMALLGERDGHSGIFPLDETHDRPLHLYPLRLYEFSDGFFVVDTVDRPDLVGARLLSIGGRPVEEVARAVRPLVPRDNGLSRRARLAQHLVVVEILRGLGFENHRFEFNRGAVTLEPVAAPVYANAFEDLAWHPMIPQGTPHTRPSQSVSKRGDAVYLAYDVTLGDTSDLAAEVVRRSRVADRVVLDVRRNPGGDNGTYRPLLAALTRLRVPLFVLIGRTTFSAAANFITELERARDDVVFVGEPSGGAPNQYGDPVPVALPTTGWTVHVAHVYWEKSRPDDPRIAIEPDMAVELASSDFFAGRDSVLTASLRRAPR